MQGKMKATYIGTNMNNEVEIMIKKAILFLLVVSSVMAVNANAQSEIIPSYPGLIVDPAFTEINSYDGYTDFIENHPVPENFVEYSEVDGFGTFVNMLMMDDNQAYTYVMADEKGYYIWLTIDHNEYQMPEDIDERMLRVEDAENLWKHPGNKDGYIVLEECVFTYSAGKLSSIEWGTEGLSYDLRFIAPSVTEQTGTKTTMLERLLDLDSARDTIRELHSLTAVVPGDAKTDHTLAWFITGGIALVVGACGVCILLHRRKKQKNSESISTE